MHNQLLLESVSLPLPIEHKKAKFWFMVAGNFHENDGTYPANTMSPIRKTNMIHFQWVASKYNACNYYQLKNDTENRKNFNNFVDRNLLGAFAHEYL